MQYWVAHVKFLIHIIATKGQQQSARLYEQYKYDLFPPANCNAERVMDPTRDAYIFVLIIMIRMSDHESFTTLDQSIAKL